MQQIRKQKLKIILAKEGTKRQRKKGDK